MNHYRMIRVLASRLGSLALMFLCVRVAADCSPLPAGARLWFRFEDGFADHIRRLPGTADAGAAIGPGFVGAGGLQLTESGAGVVIRPPSGIVNTAAFTIEGWVKRASRTQVAWDDHAIFFAGTTNGIAFGMLPDGRLFLGRTGGARVNSVEGIVDEGWHHVAANFNGSHVQLSLDGVPAGSGQFPEGFAASSSYALGRYPAPINGMTATFQGAIDEWTVHNTQFDTDGVQATRASGADGRCPTPVIVRIEPLPDLIRTNFPVEFQVTLGNSHSPEGTLRGVTLPRSSGIRFDSASVTRGTVSLVAGQIVWQLPGPPLGQPATLTVRGTGADAKGDYDLRAMLNGVSEPVAQALIHVVDGCEGIPGSTVTCPRDLTVEAPSVLNYQLSPTNYVLPFTVRVRNPSSEVISGAKLSILSTPGKPFTEVTARDAQVIPIPNGFRVEFADLVPGQVQVIKVGPWRGGDLDVIRYEIEAPNLDPEGVASRRRTTTHYQTGTDCNGAPEGTAFWMPGRFDISDQMGGQAVRTEGTVPMLADGLQTGAGTLVVDGPSVFDGESWTVQAWVLPQAADGFVDVVFSHESASAVGAGPNFALGRRGPREPAIGAAEGRLMVRYRSGAGLSDDGDGWTDTGVDLPLGRWAHVAMGHDSRRMMVWLDGRLVADFARNPEAPAIATGSFRVGGRDPAFAPAREGFNGLVRQVLATTRLLETIEVEKTRLFTLFGICPADAAVAWTSPPVSAPLGVPFRMAWSLTNSGPIFLEGVRFEADLPAGWEVLEMQASTGTIRREGDRIVANLDFLVRNAPVSLSATIRATTLLDGELTARVSAVTPAEITLTNNAASSRVRITEPVFVPAASSVVEGPSRARTPLRVEVRLTHPLDQEARVDYRVEALPPGSGPDSAVVGDDFEPSSGTLLFAPGMSVTNVVVHVLGDDWPEGSESFRFVLENPTPGSVVSPPLVLGIVDDDPPAILQIGDALANEGAGDDAALAFEVRLSKAARDPIRLGWTVEPGTAEAGMDFEGTTGTVDIPAGEVAATIRIPVHSDTLAEPTEYLRVNLTLPPGAVAGFRIRDGTAVGTILDDDAPAAAVARFEIVAPTGPIPPGSSFPVEIRAMNGVGETATGFDGTVDLSAVPLGRPTDSGLPSSLVLGEVHHPDGSFGFKGAELWNVTPAPLDLTGWRFSLYTQQSWPLPLTNWAFPTGKILAPGDFLFIGDAPVGGTPGGSFQVGPLGWGTMAPDLRVEEQRFAVLVQDASGRVVEFFSSGGGKPSEIHVPVSVDPTLWGSPRLPSSVRTTSIQREIHQRTGNSQTRDGAGWFHGLGEVRNRYLRTPFIDARIQPTSPSIAAGFVDGVWRGQISVPAPTRWMALNARGPGGIIGVRTPLQFDVGGDLAIHAHEFGVGPVGGGRLFRQRVVVTNGSPAEATDVTLRLIPPPGFPFLASPLRVMRVSQGTNQLIRLPDSDEFYLQTTFGTLPPYATAELEVEIPHDAPASPATREARWVAEISSAEADVDPTNNRTERFTEIAHAPALPGTNRIAWLPANGNSQDRLGRLTTTAENISYTPVADRQAFRFGGDSRIHLNPDPAFVPSPSADRRLLFNFRFRSTDSSRPRMTILSVPASGNGPGWSIELLGGRPSIRMGDTVHTQAQLPDLCNGEWHFLAFLIGAPGEPQQMWSHRTSWIPLTNSLPTPPLQTDPRLEAPAILGSSLDGHPFVGDLDEVILALIPKDQPLVNGLVAPLNSAGALGTAEGILTMSELRRGGIPARPPMIVGRPYTWTIGVQNTGSEPTSPVLGAIWKPVRGSVTEAFWNGVQVPLVTNSSGHSLRLPPMPPGATGVLAVVVLPDADGPITQPIQLQAGLRDTTARLDLSSTVLADADSDGLPSAWESLHSLNPTLPGDAFLDSDGDGYSNRAEFDAGTLPLDPQSFPRSEWTLLEGTRLRIRVMTTSDRDYRLEGSPSLAVADWQALRTVPGTGSIVEFEAEPLGRSTEGYYRVRIIPLW